MRIVRRFVISGRVQGVGFRYFTQTAAEREHIDGWVRNTTDGHVEIVQAATDRTRTGTGEHAEYYTTDERIILRGGQPQMVDSKKGYTRGAELTYFVNDDRLLVTGSPKQRATRPTDSIKSRRQSCIDASSSMIAINLGVWPLACCEVGIV